MNTLQKQKKGKGGIEKSDHKHPNPKKRLAAVEKTTDPEVLIEVACCDESPRVRLTAVSRLTDDIHLDKVARTAESLDARLVAVERVFSQGVVADLLLDPGHIELVTMCFSKITDRRMGVSSTTKTTLTPPSTASMRVRTSSK